MDSLIIKGNSRKGSLEGQILIGGAKNAALPCLAATLLTSAPMRINSLPMVNDIRTMCRLLNEMGKEALLTDKVAEIKGHVTHCRAPYERVKTMRASILVLGPLLAHYGEAEVSLPGGCAIGARPVDLHIKALQKMGAEISLEHGYLKAKCKKLRAAEIVFEKVTVTGTENILMAATLADGTTLIRNAAREPEIGDLIDLLTAMGAHIQGKDTDTLIIKGTNALTGADHAVVPDRIETGTYVCAAAITGSHVTINKCKPQHLTTFLDCLEETGLKMIRGENFIEVLPHHGLCSRDIQTEPFPGFPTDMQAQYMAVMTQAQGRAMISENIFENRFMHVQELVRMGAKIKVEGHNALVTGPGSLSAAEVMATDLRASASLVLAALIADGESTIRRIYHLDRGYDDLAGKLKMLGAQIQRISQ